MAYSCKVLADSISPIGVRLVTFEVTYPRFVHAELMTHRVFSRNSASSRAIPVTKMIQQVQEDPAGPVWWGKNQAGMQAETELHGISLERAKASWLMARDNAVIAAHSLLDAGAHKQIVNRLLEPWMWITVLITATEWDNFFALRCHHLAQPEIRRIADMMYLARSQSEPTANSGWHLPIAPDLQDLKRNYNLLEIARIVAGRCARVSYLTHTGERDPTADLELADRLAAAGHMSPFEHVARAMKKSVFEGNFRGWVQLRKLLPNEDCFKQ